MMGVDHHIDQTVEAIKLIDQLMIDQDHDDHDQITVGYHLIICPRAQQDVAD